MPPRSLVALLALVALLVVAAPSAAVLGASPGAPAAPGHAVDVADAMAQAETTTGTTATDSPSDLRESSHTTMRLQIQPDGDARWQISVTFPIRDANDSAAFDDIASDFERADTPLGLDAFVLAAKNASTATGREMDLRNRERSHFRENGTGTLVLEFTWSNFARVSGDNLAVGDAFNTTTGTWLPNLPERTTLVIAPPDGYGVSDAPEVGIVGGAARWDGPYDFGGREPWIVYSGDAPTPTTSATPNGSLGTTAPGTGSPGGNGTETPPGGPFSAALPIVLLVVVAGVSAAVLAIYMRSDEDGFGGIGALTSGSGGNPDDRGATDQSATADDTPGDGAGAVGGATNSHGNPGGDAAAGETAAAGAGASAAAAADARDADDEVDEALLSDEERVERLLERNGGRMKQASIVQETGWSNAKVSQLLSAMAEDGRVDKLRIGRENLISFPDEDVTDIDSE